MNTPSARILVFAGEKFACIKIIGRANLNSSVSFKTLINELRQKGYTYFVLDLAECLLMDSTFLGVLAGFGLKMSLGQEDPGSRAIELLNPNPRVTELLENLGVLHLFRITEGPLTPPAGAEARDYPCDSGGRVEVTRACMEAHETLVQINPANAAKFKEVTQFLAEDLKKLNPNKT
jgi:anti-anti-sigma regulatory factor